MYVLYSMCAVHTYVHTYEDLCSIEHELRHLAWTRRFSRKQPSDPEIRLPFWGPFVHKQVKRIVEEPNNYRRLAQFELRWI